MSIKDDDILAALKGLQILSEKNELLPRSHKVWMQLKEKLKTVLAPVSLFLRFERKRINIIERVLALKDSQNITSCTTSLCAI